MEEKSKDAGALPAASTIANAATDTPPNASDTAAAEPPSSRRRGQKRKTNNHISGNASSLQMISSKRQAREKPSAVPFPPIFNGPWTRARQSPNTATAAAPASAAGSFAGVVKKVEEAVSPPECGGGKAVKAAAEESNAAEEDLEALEAKIVAEYEAVRSRNANAHVVPIPSGWFSWTKVHPLEQRALPSFFNVKSENRSSEIYMEIRNWIVNKFHASPNSQIELKHLSELSVGELEARQEVMEFLDHWGLINYHPIPDTDSVMENVDATEVVRTDSLVEKLYRFQTEYSCPPVVTRTNVAKPAASSGLFRESAIAEELARPEGPAVELLEYHCNSCSADCSRKRYHCQKQADFDLCTECFNNEKFGSDMSPSDFILMEPAEVPGVSGGKWTDQETLLLLEALELYKENWNEIAEHVGTKTKAQCILHFVQMPIEDTFLDSDAEIYASHKENATPVSTNIDSSMCKDAPETRERKMGLNEFQHLSFPMETSKPEDASELKADQEIIENCALMALREAFEAVGSLPTVGDELSFSEAGNPVMALAAFLVQLVEPNVATALARSSVKSISDVSSGIQLAARHIFLLEDPPDYEKKSDDSERAVEQDAHPDGDQNHGNQIEENCNSVLDGSNLSNDHSNRNKKDSTTEEKGESVSPIGECTDKSHVAKEPDAIATHEEVGSDNPVLSKDQALSTMEESDDLISKVELPPSSGKESGDGVSAVGSSQPAEAPKNVDVLSDSLPMENKEPVQPVTSNSMVEHRTHTDEEEAKDCKNEIKEPPDTKNDHNIDRIKRAAVTAISAAAVKAKLLANQEEEQIQQLVILLIQKQIYKLERKLAFFSEMESVVMRVREQMERLKQRLFQERAQIIAVRLGFSASNTRHMQQPLPTNRLPMSFANQAQKSPMSMTAQRPSVSRPDMTPAPPTSQPSNKDKLSSVGMK